MRIHSNQINPNLALEAAYAAQKAEAKREAEATRKKLFQSAFRLAANDDDFIVSIGMEQESSEEQSGGESRQQQAKNAKQDDKSEHISDWV